jgi:hypothetical protein
MQNAKKKNTRGTKRPKRARKASKVQGVRFEALETRELMAVINVADFGAKPNDGGNDLGAIQAAINASKTGDTVLFNGGTFDLQGLAADGLTVPGDRTYKGTNGATLRGRGSNGQLVTLHADNVTFTGLTFDGGGLFMDRSGGFNNNIVLDYNTFKINTSGEHTGGITFTSGLRNSKITNNYFTGYGGNGFAIYGYNYNTLTIANNEVVNVAAGFHIDAFYDSGNLLVEQNYITGAKGMGMEFQSSATNLTFQDNWFENPNLSTTFNSNNNSMAFSLILDKSSNVTIRRNTVIAPKRPDGVGCRMGFEVGGDNTLVEDNYINGVNHVLAMNDGVGSASVTVRNNRFMNYLQNLSNSFPRSNVNWSASNNGPSVKLTNAMESRIASNQKPGIGAKRYDGSVTTTPQTPPTPQTPTTPTPEPLPTSPSGLAAIVTGPTTVNLFWTDRSINETTYKVEKSTDGKTWTEVASLGKNAVTYTVKNLTAGQAVSFRVRAINATGSSDASNVAAVTPQAFDPSLGTFVSDMAWTSSKNFWGGIELDRSNGEMLAGDGRLISIGGKTYGKGLGVHGASEIRVALSGKYDKFLSDIGIDDETAGNGSVTFEVWADGVKLYDSGTLSAASGRKSVSVDVAGKNELVLVVTNAGDGMDFDHADWADARLTPAVSKPADPPPTDDEQDNQTPDPDPTSPTVTYISDMDWSSISNGWGTPELDKSNGERKSGDGKTITLNGKTYTKGIGAHSTGDIRYALDGKYTSFLADIGIDDEVGRKGTVCFQVWTDGVKVYDSGLMTGASETKSININVAGKNELWLVVTNGGDNRDCDHADWADARLVGANPPPAPTSINLSELTPATVTNGWGTVEANTSVGEKLQGDGKAMTINGRVYTNGLGVHSDSKLVYNLNGAYSTFITDLGIDDEVGNKGSVTFEVWADGVKLYDSGVVKGSDTIRSTTVSVAGKNELWLVVTNGGDNFDFDHANWANARLVA